MKFWEDVFTNFWGPMFAFLFGICLFLISHWGNNFFSKKKLLSYLYGQEKWFDDELQKYKTGQKEAKDIVDIILYVERYITEDKTTLQNFSAKL